MKLFVSGRLATFLPWNNHQLFLCVSQAIQAFHDFLVIVPENFWLVDNDDFGVLFPAELNKVGEFLLVMVGSSITVGHLEYLAVRALVSECGDI
jgi:hypothetical protein